MATRISKHTARRNGLTRYISTTPEGAGFTLFFAVLIASLLLAIGLAIFNITIKELVLSSSVRDSEFAFYAADSGAECALFWDRTQDAFSTTSPQPQIVCNGAGIPVSINEGTSIFTIDVDPADNYCSVVTVIKGESGSTTIESRGYNTCNTANPRRVERGIRVRY